MKIITPQERLEQLPFEPATVQAAAKQAPIRLEDYRDLPPSDLKLPPMDYHIIAFHYKPPDGLLRHRCGGVWQEAQMNLFDITYVPAFMDNQWQFDGNAPHCLHVLLADELVQRTALQTRDIDPARIGYQPHFKNPSRAIRQIVLEIFQGMQAGLGADELEHVGHSLALELLGGETKVVPGSARLSMGQMRLVKSYLYARLDRPVKLEQLAGLLNMSVYHFARLFRNGTGLSPYEFLTQIRVDKAAELLVRQPSLPISEIALTVGFSDQSHLTRHFRKRFGTTPRRVRMLCGR